MPATAAASSASSATAGSARPSPRAPSTRTKANGNGGNGTHSGTPVPQMGPATYQTAPLSSRRAPPLDLSTVETRSTAKEVRKTMRPHNLQEAPTYTPTTEEFKDPMEYIRSIQEEGMKYGIVKIIPPENWQPDFGVDTERFHFRTRRQELNSVEGGTRANLNYLDQLSKYHKQHGTTLNRFPSVDKRPLDLYRLKKAVEVRGGFDKVCKGKKWAEIGRDLGYSGKIMSSLSTSLKNSYQRYLQPYEEWVKSAKPGVQREIEAAFGGPISPSPASSPVKKMTLERAVNSPLSSFGADSPAVRHPMGTPDRSDTEMMDATPLKPSTPAPTSGFTPVNSGFTPVNVAPASFASVNAANGMKREAESGLTPGRMLNGLSASMRSTPEVKAAPAQPKRPHGPDLIFDGTGTPNGAAAPEEKGRDEDGEEPGERRSKRLKKEPAPMVAGSHMTLHKPSGSVPRTLGDRTHNKPGEKCETCGRGGDMNKLLLCDSCDNGYHTYCLDPALQCIPDRDWYCNHCLVGTGEYGFADGEIYSLRQFQEKANNFKDMYFASKMPFDPVLNTQRKPTEDDVEREFWKLVESVQDTVEVEYGADIHSTTHGSGFPTTERHPTNPYSSDPWNLNVLPLHPESLFKHIKSDVSGMTVPWLYVGMCFSTFCWHNEDHFTYSANYQHFGATKTWYGIPGDDAERFEEAMREAVPELFEQQPDLLFQLVTLLTPQHLAKTNIKVYAIDQRAGQFVITFPKAYHAGFNHGFNFNEAVNFAPSDWEPYGQEGIERYQRFRRAPVFSHDELLLTAAARDTSIKSAQWLAPALERMKNKELQARSELLQLAPDIQQVVLPEDTDLAEEEYMCCVCKVYCYLSQVTCSCTSNIACPTHHRDVCDCESSKLTLRIRVSDEVLEEIAERAREKANIPMAWSEKLHKLIRESPLPSLKMAKALLAEGEKIPYYLPELTELKRFVDRAQEWVDEATPFISRKQQNRRKNEKVWRKGSTKAAEMEERERDHRKPETIIKLLKSADSIGFDCPEVEQLTERHLAIRNFQTQARAALATPGALTTANYEELVELGKSFNVDLAETDLLEKIVKQLKWVDNARDFRSRFLSLKDVTDLIKAGQTLGIPDTNEQLSYFKSQKEAGEMWEAKAKELMSVEIVHFQQLEALSGQASTLPVSQETLQQVDQILNKQREAHRQIVALYEASKSEDFLQRPRYKDVKEVLDGLAELHSKPTGTVDLEKEQKRHEDWMRRGKKLFGKANAPLHILAQHMQYVESRNKYCFALEDRPRTPVEPSSREPSPDGKSNPFGDREKREVFCICRQPEAGMMIECEVCHEWYHGKCLKIARGKVKEDDKYTCPICDYRVRIPRDAARPKLEDLQDWQNEIPTLPFVPDEMDCLHCIIEQATKFRDFVAPLTASPLGLTFAEVPSMRFYLRKIEGAEILLARETNFFRAELHRWDPIAPEPPQPVDVSVSTRKPRPTKQQKLMAQMGVNKPEELPPQFRTKAHQFGKKKSAEPTTKPPPPIKPAPTRHTVPLSPTSVSDGNHHLPAQPRFDYSNVGYSANGRQDSPVFSGFNGSPRLGSPVLANNSARGHTLDPALFNPPTFHGNRPPPVTQNDSNGSQYGSSTNRDQELNSMFEQMTNSDAYAKDSASIPGRGMNYASLAAEALDTAADNAADNNLADQFLSHDA